MTGTYIRDRTRMARGRGNFRRVGPQPLQPRPRPVEVKNAGLIITGVIAAIAIIAGLAAYSKAFTF